MKHPKTKTPKTTINFTALDKYESPRARAAWERKFSNNKSNALKRFSKQLTLLILVLTGCILFLLLASINIMLAAPIAVVAVCWVIYTATHRRKLLKQVAEQFARDNNWQLNATPPEFHLTSITPNDAINARTSEPVISGQLSGCDFWLYRYEYTVESTGTDADGDATTTRHTFAYEVLSVEMPERLPVFLLDAKIDGAQEVRNGLFKNQLQKLKLEGDFNDYFDLWQQAESQIDTLSIFTPELMEVLAREHAHFNIESDGKYLHTISTYGDLLAATPVRHLFTSSQLVLDRVLRKLKTFSIEPKP